PFSAMLVAFVDLIVGSSVLIALMIWYRVPPSPYIVLLPFVALVHVIFTAAVSLLVAMGNLFYRDVKYLFEVVVAVWMFATSVLYPVRGLEGHFGTILRLNPMSVIIDGYRDVIFGSGLQEPAMFSATAVFSLGLLLVGWVTFHRSEFEFAERI